MRYLRRLAAGVVDYIDFDPAPTSVNGGEPAGRDLFPLVAAVAERFRRTSIDTNAATTTIESQCFVQVWNHYTTEIILSNQSLRFVVRNRMKVNFGTGIVTPFNDYDQTHCSERGHSAKRICRSSSFSNRKPDLEQPRSG